MLEASLHFSKASHGKQTTWKAPGEQLQINRISPKPEQFCSSRTRSAKTDGSKELVSEIAAGSLWHDPKSSKCFICSYRFLPLKEVIYPGKLLPSPKLSTRISTSPKFYFIFAPALLFCIHTQSPTQFFIYYYFISLSGIESHIFFTSLERSLCSLTAMKTIKSKAPTKCSRPTATTHLSQLL